MRARSLVLPLLLCLLGAAPSLLWASGAMFIAMAPLLVPLAVWVYALVFAFASLWCLFQRSNAAFAAFSLWGLFKLWWVCEPSASICGRLPVFYH